MRLDHWGKNKPTVRKAMKVTPDPGRRGGWWEDREERRYSQSSQQLQRLVRSESANVNGF